MIFDIKNIPFSRYGSYFCISEDIKDGLIYLRDVHGGDEAPSKLFSMELLKRENSIKSYVKLEETLLTIFEQNNDKNYIEICFPKEDEVHIFIKNTILNLKANKVKYDSFMQLAENEYEYYIYPKELKLKFSLLKGNIEVDAPWNIIGNEYIDIKVDSGNEEYAHLVIEGYKTISKNEKYLDFKEAKKYVHDEYNGWYKNTLDVDEKYIASKKLASYITWSSVVKAERNLNDYAMYMSKNWMYNIWSWDNCFNALALAKNNPRLAFSQYKIFIDNQDESGIYPDFVNEKFISFNCCKPPIFPYFYLEMANINDYFLNKDRLKLVYNSFKKMLNYWLDYRRFKDNLPHYRHGNDSGWDNASLFHECLPVESPDLTSHLIKSLDAMSHFAKILGRTKESEEFTQKADDLFELLMKRLYDKKGFFGRKGFLGDKINNRDSLILYLPIIIGYRLDKNILDSLVKDLKENFETKFGLATESYNSNLYKENGYWLGPIWAPVTYLFIDSLNKYGYNEYAQRITKKFLDMTLIGGMAENFDPFTGKGLVDPAFTWTSSVFLLLGEMNNK